MFAPVILATVRLSDTKNWLWSSGLLMLVSHADRVRGEHNLSDSGNNWNQRGIVGCVFRAHRCGPFLLSEECPLGHHFPPLYRSQHLSVAWDAMVALYSAVDITYPGSFVRANNTATGGQSELLYFSLITLSTVGYGEIVPLHGEVRMLPALEAVTGILYVAITVAILVSGYRPQSSSS
jgi:hypothetical protein